MVFGWPLSPSAALTSGFVGPNAGQLQVRGGFLLFSLFIAFDGLRAHGQCERFLLSGRTAQCQHGILGHRAVAGTADCSPILAVATTTLVAQSPSVIAKAIILQSAAQHHAVFS